MTSYLMKKCREFYLLEIEKKKGFFTSIDLQKKINRSLGYVRNMINWRKRTYPEEISLMEVKFYPAKYKVME